MTKLWQTSTELDPLVEKYTVGNDYKTDLKLLPYDLQASKAHAKMLAKTGILSEVELNNLLNGLDEIKKLHASSKFKILPGQEDIHTAIEQYLTKKYGKAGKKIHTGRSRNDQVLAALRLYMKDSLKLLAQNLKLANKEFRTKGEQYRNLPMPGYTHMQKAMPTTVSKWLESYGDALNDIQILVEANLKVIDQNPLGSASGFGLTNFKLDREFTGAELGFANVQENEIYCANSRGFFELMCLQNMCLAMILCSKFASDMLLFTTTEFDYFSLPDEFTTGSSIMPNKRNYDVLEIMRGTSSVLNGQAQQVHGVISVLGSGFQRDLQLTKEPFVKGAELTNLTLEVLIKVAGNIQAKESNLKSAMTEDLYATKKVYDQVAAGMSFRDAYKKIKQDIEKKEKGHQR